jgi:hypothetical protein
MTAIGALEKVCESTTVEKEDSLFSHLERLPNSVVECAGPRNWPALRHTILFSHVDELHGRKGARRDARRKVDRVPPIAGSPRFQRRRGAPQHRASTLELCPPQGHVSRVIPRRLAVLIAGIVLLIDHQSPEVRHRGKHG